MIYFFAGAHRNGSHFQFYVAQEAFKQIGQPFHVLDPVPFHKHNLTASKQILYSAAEESGTFFVKGHWYKKRELELLRSCPNLRVLVIWRDVWDAMMSAYRYYYAKKRIEAPRFKEFYWKGIGRWMLIEQFKYRLAYRDYDAFHSSYEGLVEDFPGEAGRLLGELGIREQVDLARLEAAISKPQLRKTYGDENAIFFSRSHSELPADERLDEACLSDLGKLEGMSGTRLAAESWIEVIRQAPRYLAHRLSSRLPAQE